MERKEGIQVLFTKQNVTSDGIRIGSEGQKSPEYLLVLRLECLGEFLYP